TVSALTGITDAMVRDAPTPSEVLPTLMEFVGGAVLVGHNLRFDVGFLDAALLADERSPIGLWSVDTLALARRLLGDEVPDHRLGTLADHLDLDHRPTHRALDDVLATADLLHALLERATAFGVTVLDDLLLLPRLAAHAQSAKLRLTNRLPRSAGVAVLRDGQGQPLHVTAAGDDLRRQVRSWFSGEGGRIAGPVLREVHAVEHLACTTALAADVAEVRLADSLTPRRSPRVTAWKSYRYVRLGGGRGKGPTGAPALTVGRTPGHGRHLGPLPSAADARAVVEAVGLVTGSAPAHVPGTTAGGRPVDEPASLFDEPASLFDDPASLPTETEAPPVEAAGPPVGPAVGDLFDDPGALLAALHERAARARADRQLARATAIVAMAEALGEAVRARRWSDTLRRADRVVMATVDGEGVELVRGRPVRSWVEPGDATAESGRDHELGVHERGRHDSASNDHACDGAGTRHGATGDLERAAFGPVQVLGSSDPLTPAVADELACVAAWIDRHAHHLRLQHVDGELSSPLPARPADVARQPAPAGLRCAAC
ncbi:MAG: exonuclease domain-containing protein, partial [Acidimicrobiales bacterium]|nr:exonuclease domain-containing protein [Acidimicrobiales bacterium]